MVLAFGGCGDAYIPQIVHLNINKKFKLSFQIPFVPNGVKEIFNYAY